ncbi:MAG: transglycosylase domain-containing protein, partial [Oscillospiraceae bacterium]|nr:transglycosylase domain-containing protein [Oscillospiraceae bacterium]
DAADLSLSQSASLAATIKAPSAYAPHTNPENNRTRRLYILRLRSGAGSRDQQPFHRLRCDPQKRAGLFRRDSHQRLRCAVLLPAGGVLGRDRLFRLL